jgi:hypothetical protein
MTISLKTVMDNLPPEQRARVEQRAAELIAEEMTLQDLRKARVFKDPLPVKISGFFSTIAESCDQEEQ